MKRGSLLFASSWPPARGDATAWTCPSEPGVICTAIAVSSLNVTVRDAATGARVCDATVVAVHQSGERHDLMPFPPDPQSCAYAGPWERAGEFEVRVSRPGYQDARRGRRARDRRRVPRDPGLGPHRPAPRIAGGVSSAAMPRAARTARVRRRATSPRARASASSSGSTPSAPSPRSWAARSSPIPRCWSRAPTARARWRPTWTPRLRAAGLRAGRYTSPHLVRVNERIAVGGERDHRPAPWTRRGGRRAQRGRAPGAERPHRRAPTYFEALTAAAFLHFRARRVDVAVLEVGMGGRLDATNVAEPLASADRHHRAWTTSRTWAPRWPRSRARRRACCGAGAPPCSGRMPPQAEIAIRRAADRAGARLRGRDGGRHRRPPARTGSR